MIQERYILVSERLQNVRQEPFPIPPLSSYFQSAAELLLKQEEVRKEISEARKRGVPEEELSSRCAGLLEELLPDRYEGSFASHGRMKEILREVWAELGEKRGTPPETYARLLGALYFELVIQAAAVYEDRAEDLLIHRELFAEVYTSFLYEWEENEMLPSYESLQQILYWFVWDYSQAAAERLAVMRRAGRGEGPGLGFSSELISSWNPAALLLACGERGFLEDGCPWRFSLQVPALLEKAFADHEDDRALLWDRNLAGWKLEIYRAVLKDEKATALKAEKEAVLKNGKDIVSKAGKGAESDGPETVSEGRRAVPEEPGSFFVPAWECEDPEKRRIWERYWKKMEEIWEEFAVFPRNV